MRPLRPLILIVGILIVAAGVILAVVPLVPDTSKSVSANSPATFHLGFRVPVLPSEPVAASWTSSASVTIVLRTCASINSSATTIWGQCTGGSNVTMTGTSGSTTTSIPPGGYLWVALVGPAAPGANHTASLALSTSSPSGALGLWAFGGLLVALGALFLYRKRKRIRAAEASRLAALSTPLGAPPPIDPPGSSPADESTSSGPRS
ncbi:MAG: hypothetical protein WA691_01465 [Thermoplasmata archaeon]